MRRTVAMACLMSFVVACPFAASADPRVALSVTVIEARKGPPFLHEALKPLWELLQKSFGEKFSYYDLVGVWEQSVEVNGRVETNLPDGDRFAAIYGGITPEKGLIRVSLEYGDFRTKVRIHDRGTFFQAGKRWRDGTLVIAVKATILEP